MSEPSIVQRLVRERAMWRYITALEEGNLDVIAAIVKRAENDEVLEKMILELHETYQTEEDFLALFQEEKSMEIAEGLHKSGLSGQLFTPEPLRRSIKHPRLLQTLVAALMAFCLIGGLLLYSGLQRGTQVGRSSTSYNWCIVPLSQIDRQGQISFFSDMVAVSSESIWLVGQRNLENSNNSEKVSGRYVPQFIHWDGLNWNSVDSADITSQINALKLEAQGKTITEAGASLNRLAVLSADNIWAVGSVDLSLAHTSSQGSADTQLGHTLIEHWDGHSWQVVASPNRIAPQGTNVLNSIIALAPDNIWAAGSASISGSLNVALNSTTPLIEHWDGKQWNLVSLPATLQRGAIKALSASAPDDIWIVGVQESYLLSVTPLPFVAHWNGQVWSSFSQPSPLSWSSFSDINVLAKNNAWAVGSFSDTQRISSDPAEASLLAHWDGRSWNGVRGAIVPETRSGLTSITTNGPNDIWMAGSIRTAAGIEYPLIEHWDGKNWRIVSTKSTPQGTLSKILIVENHIWVMGETTIPSSSSYSNLPTGPLIQRNC